MIRRLLARAADFAHALGWALIWRLGRKAGRMAVMVVRCPDCGATLTAHLNQAGRAMRLHDRAHDLLDRIESEKGGVPDRLPEGWTK